MTERTCPVCDGPMVRRANEHPAKWLARKTCSVACGNELAQQKFAAVIATRPASPPKPCAVCGAMMTRGYTESRKRYDARTTCSRKCQGEQATLKAGKVPMRLKLAKPLGRPALPAELRPCVCCGRDIPKPDGMTWAKYRAKTTCGAEACKTAQTRRPMTGGPSEIVAAVTTLTLPSPKQRLAWQQASDAERRLFDPGIAMALWNEERRA